jgi:cardiolipin synthase
MDRSKWKSYITNRIIISAILLLIQVVWFIIIFTALVQYSSWLTLFWYIVGFLMVLFIMSRELNSSYKIAWILVILVLPLFGTSLYLIFANNGLPKRWRTILTREEGQWAKILQQNPAVLQKIQEQNSRFAGTCRYLSQYNHYPVYQDTRVTYYPSGEQMFMDMLPELEAAEKFIFLEFFIVSEGVMWKSILDILQRKAAQGVDVRFIYDDVGSIFLLPPDYKKYLRQIGIKCVAFNPFVPVFASAMNNRDHRKILIVDGHTAFSGGINLEDCYINVVKKHGHWKDTGFRLQGEAARTYTALFLQTWHLHSDAAEDKQYFCPPIPGMLKAASHPGFVQPFGQNPYSLENVARNVYLDILNQAENYVYIFTPYLIPDDELLCALCLAAKRGVDVRIVTPGIPDKKAVFRATRSNYPTLLRQGVRVYEYSPGFMHAKSFVADDHIAVVGTINMDFRSLYLHFECGTLLYDTPTVLEVRDDVLATLPKCREIHLENCPKGFINRLVNGLFRIFSPML